MEQNYIEKQVKNQIQLIVRETNSEVNYSALRFQSKLKLSGIFIIPNKGKGPPGQQRSPGYFPEHPPDEVATPDRVSNPVGGKNHIFNSIQFFKTIKPHFLTQLKFTIMKKQIFIFAFFVLAVFAGINKSYGQATHFSPATTPTGCPDDALNPIAGKPYTYSAAVSPIPGTAKWHVVAGTPTQQFITAGSWVPTDETTAGTYILSSTPDPLSPLAVSASPSTVSITWESTGLAEVIADPTNKKLFVAIEYAGTADCANNNLQVWEINPINAFTIDVFNTDGTNILGAAGATASTCYSSVASASYNASTPGTIDIDYGTNTITYEIVAANFTGSFSSTIQVSGLQAGQTADISWGYTIALSKSNTPIETGVGNGTYGPIQATIDPTTDTGTGVSIFVTLTIHNNNWEGQLADDGITLAATATNAAGQTDVATDCTDDTGFSDSATNTLMRRPNISTPVPSPFLIKN